MTIVLAVWLWVVEPRRWLRWLGVAALGTVIAQGVLGGLTVLYLLPTPISVLHGCLAQTFFCITLTIALYTSPRWAAGRVRRVPAGDSPLPRLCLLLVAVVFGQLILGAVMRHTQSGLAVLGFPLDYQGRLFPELGASALQRYNEHRRWDHFLPDVTTAQMVYHMAHRIWAAVVAGIVVWTAATVLRRHRDVRGMLWPAAAALALLAVQIGLGAWTVLSHKSEYVASAHVAVGAAMLGTVWLLALQTRRRLVVSAAAHEPVLVPVAGAVV